MLVSTCTACSEPSCRSDEILVGMVCKRTRASDGGRADAAGDVDDPDASRERPSDDQLPAPARDAQARSEHDDGEMPTALEPDASDRPDDGSVGPDDSGVTSDARTSPTATPCEPNPCAEGLSCTPVGTTGTSCTAACAPGCALGATCVAHTDCGGDNSCDPTAKVCVASCASTTIRTRDDLESARFCTTVNGDLIFDTDFDEVTASDFPFLRRVVGAIKGNSSTTRLKRITLAKLEALDNGFSLFEFPQLTSMSLPALLRIGTDAGAIGSIAGGNSVKELRLPKVGVITGDVTFQMLLALETLDFGSLQTVRGKFVLGVLPKLTSLSLPMLMRVNSTFSMVALLRIPFSRVSQYNSTKIADTPVFRDIGCCIPNAALDTYACSGNYTCDL